jgi:hypothetical protein
MKAISARKDRTRHLFRTYLAVLCLFAFAFSSCGEYNTDSGSRPPFNPDVRPQDVTALSIVLVNPQDLRDNLGFQGLPPDLTDAILEVQWSSGGPPQVITNMNDFFTIPAGITQTVPGSEEFRIAHRGSTTVSNPFTIDKIIPLMEISLTTTSPVIWYSDQRPDLSNLLLEGHWVWDQMNLDDNTLKRAIPLSTDFPFLDMERVVSDNTATLSIDTHAVEFQLTRYFQVSRIVFIGASNEFYLYDDQFLRSDPSSAAVDLEVIFNLLENNNAAFRVFYQEDESRVITWREFLSNWEYALEVMDVEDSITLPDDIFVAHGGLITEDGNYQGTLAHNEEIWTFVLEYAPPLHGGDDYMRTLTVRIPVFVFHSLTSANRRPDSDRTDIWVQQFDADFVGGIDDVPGLFDTISDRWVLNGIYTRGEEERARQIPWEKSMFNADLGLRPYPALTEGQTHRDWPLPVTWRGQTLTGQSTIQLNIFQD